MTLTRGTLQLALFTLAMAFSMPGACADQVSPQAVPIGLPATDAAALDRAIAGAWRSPANTVRDKYRHPRETLAFFGLRANQTVIEVTPGAGWYTEILAPFLHDKGHFFLVVDDPANVKAAARDETDDLNSRLEAKLAQHNEIYALAIMREMDPAAPNLGPAGSADVVLTFRNVHNWVMDGTQAVMFKAIFAVLKPGGVLGLTDHRAKPGPPTDGKMGYLTEQQVIEYATAAGFVLDARSEINANPKDTKDYPQGVWTLPPTLRLGEQGRAKYQAIGESDRMTLRFVKPGSGAKK